MWLQVLQRRWFGTAPLRPLSAARRRSSTMRLRLEALEDRTLPSSYTANTVQDLINDIITANVAGGANTITLAAGADLALTQAYATDSVGASGLPAIAAGNQLTIIGGADQNHPSIIERAPTRLAILQQPRTGSAGQPLGQIRVAVENAQHQIVTGDNSDVVTLSVHSGLGRFDPTSTLQATVSNGIATFVNPQTVQLDVAGTYVLRAAARRLHGVDLDPITISPAQVSKVVFRQVPTSGQAGAAMQHVITALADQYGNVETGLNGATITVAVATGPATSFASSSTLNVAVVKGVAVFSDLVLDAAGSYTLGATSPGVTPATSGGFMITPAAAAQLAFIQPPGVGHAGQALGTVDVAVEDGFGNIETSLTQGSMTLTTTGGQTVSSHIVGGIARFPGLTPQTAGNFKLTASLGTLPPASLTIPIFSLIGTLVVTMQPQTGVVGQPLGTIQIAVEDANGNIQSSDNNDVVTLNTFSGLDSASVLTAPVVNGYATFTNVTLDLSGSPTLTFTCDGVSATTAAISVAPAVVSAVEGSFTPMAVNKLLFTLTFSQRVSGPLRFLLPLGGGLPNDARATEPVDGQLRKVLTGQELYQGNNYLFVDVLPAGKSVKAHVTITVIVKFASLSLSDTLPAVVLQGLM